VADDEIDLLKSLYFEFVQERTGYLHRGDATWRSGVLYHASAHGRLYTVVYEENGRPLGYMIYSLEGEKRPDGEPWQRIEIADLVWLTPRAYRALWRHFAGAGLVYEVAWKRVPQDDPLPHLLLEPRRLNIGARDGLLARVVDVAGAMPQRRYDEAGRLLFEVVDPLCPWNAGRWEAEIAGDRVRVERTSRTPELIIPIDTLAMLLFGQIRPSDAVRMGRAGLAEGADAREVVLARWDRVMQTRHKAFCPDFF
jgi:predicted acetyltransferase